MFGAYDMHLNICLDETHRKIILKCSDFLVLHLLINKFVQSPCFIINLYKFKNVILCQINYPGKGKN